MSDFQIHAGPSAAQSPAPNGSLTGQRRATWADRTLTDGRDHRRKSMGGSTDHTCRNDRTIAGMVTPKTVLAAALTASLALAACGGSDDAAPTTEAPASDAQPDAGGGQSDTEASGIQVVSAADAAATIDDPPADLVILDVRTPEEFDEGHIDGATMLDFYEPDFADQLATLDPEVPYVLYCRSGNRSSQARTIMAELGFTTVDDVDGGILAWQSAGLPVVTP